MSTITNLTIRIQTIRIPHEQFKSQDLTEF